MPFRENNGDESESLVIVVAAVLFVKVLV